MNILNKSIVHLKNLHLSQATLLQKELQIHTYGDLVHHFPFRYEDRTRFYTIREIRARMPFVQTRGKLENLSLTTKKGRRVLTATLRDATGVLSLVWFNGIDWIQRYLMYDQVYAVWGKPTLFQRKIVIVHPELQSIATVKAQGSGLQPIYTTTQQLTKFGLHTRGIARLQRYVLAEILPELEENLPVGILDKYNLVSRKTALSNMHFPDDHGCIERAQKRYKFEEIFYMQLFIRYQHGLMDLKETCAVFSDTKILKECYETLPFSLTEAQKKVVKAMYRDMRSGKQMHRLLQGDVGSGKTIVAFMGMLLPIAHQAQVAFMAPTEILAQQHFATLQEYAGNLHLNIALLTGSTKIHQRKKFMQNYARAIFTLLLARMHC